MKKKVIVLYGGRSTEHEISCRSASFVLANIDPTKYDVAAIAITEAGEWIPQDPALLLAAVRNMSPKRLPIHRDTQAQLSQGLRDVNQALALASGHKHQNHPEIVFFPVIHGTNGEDGSLQGFLDLADLAYVGPGTLGSAIAMDKVIAKERVVNAGVNIVPYKTIRYEAWLDKGPQFAAECIKYLGEKVFVKPATLGSSVGVNPATGPDECHQACEAAFKFDDKILVEAKINAREIECAALGGYEPDISLPGEVEAHTGFYSYDAKYMDPSASTIKVPADLTEQQSQEVRRLAKQAFMALELYGMARMDFFLCKDTGKFYFNEANTIPGFTEISQYPQLWKHSGLSEKELISRLVELAWNRKQLKDRLQRQKD